MKCTLVFDQLNDVIFAKYSKEFESHLKNVATEPGVLSKSENEGILSREIIIQTFSPIVASHRIMNCQFGNTYTTIKLQNDMNVVFEDYMGFLFVGISNKDIKHLKRYLNMCVTMSRYICGPDIYLLKSDPSKTLLLQNLLDHWYLLSTEDQSIHVEALEHLVINRELSSVTVETLRQASVAMTTLTDCSRLHVLLLAQNKVLSLYSSAQAQELSPADILFCIILNSAITKNGSNIKQSDFLLMISEKCHPHIVHFMGVSEGIFLVFLIEICGPHVARSLYESFVHFFALQQVWARRDLEALRPAVDNLDLATQKLNQSLKKTKKGEIDTSYKELLKKWDVIKKKYQEYLKNQNEESVLRADSLSGIFLENMRELFKLIYNKGNIMLENGKKYAEDVAKDVRINLRDYEDFFKTKTEKNFSLGFSSSLTVSKYLEQFPGLVHFLHLNRTSHRLTAPTLDLNTEGALFMKQKVWSMIDFSKQHLSDNNLSLIWRDSTFLYSYFLWFEDGSGAPLKPPAIPSRSFPFPGILNENVYEKIVEAYFPKISPTKLRCYELFCIHLGLVTASCALEQARRLSATIWELRGDIGRAAFDLL